MVFIDNELQNKYNKIKVTYNNKKKNNLQLKRIDSFTNYFLHNSIDNNVILYETFHGKSMTDNPYALFLEILKKDTENKFHHVWALNSQKQDIQMKRYSKLPNVEFVKVHSNEYIKYLATAKYLINNTSFPTYFQKKEGQVYVNTWHGTPLKTLGKDMQGTMGQHQNLQRNFMHTDYILSPNSFTTEKLIYSHDLDGVYKGKVIEEGYPRVDLVTNTNADLFKKEVLSKVVKLNNKKIILYAPTWRGEVGKEGNINEDLLLNLETMIDNLPSDYQLLLKVHPLLYKFVKEDKRFKNICVPDYVDTCELLSSVDCLITDYSSIFFDFYVTGKPIILYMYDKEEYLQSRGMYIDLDEITAEKAYSRRELVNSLANLSNSEKMKYSVKQENIQKYISLQKGTSANKILEVLFENNFDNKNILIFNNKNKNIIFYLDEFLNQDAFDLKRKLINNVNYNRFNAIVVVKENLDAVEEKKLKEIDSRAKIVFSKNEINVTSKEWSIQNYIIQNGIHHELYRDAEKIYSRALKKIIGDCDIDYIVNLSNINVFWTNLLAFCNASLNCNRVMYLSKENVVKIYKNEKEKKLEVLKETFNAYSDFFSDNPLIESIDKLNNPRCVVNEVGIDNSIIDNKKKLLANTIVLENKQYVYIPSSDKAYLDFVTLIDHTLFEKNSVLIDIHSTPYAEVKISIQNYQQTNFNKNTDYNIVLYGFSSKDEIIIKEYFNEIKDIYFVPEITNICYRNLFFEEMSYIVLLDEITNNLSYIDQLLRIKKNIIVKNSYSEAENLFSSKYLETYNGDFSSTLETIYKKNMTKNMKQLNQIDENEIFNKFLVPKKYIELLVGDINNGI